MHEEQDSHSLVDQDYILWALIRQTEWVIFRAREVELALHDLTPEQAAVCFYINLIGNNPTPGELSRWMVREPHTISGLLDRMKKKGLVRKDKDTERRNQVRVVLTEKGQQAFDQGTKRESIHLIFSCLTEEEREQLKSILTKLRDMTLEKFGLFKKPPFPPQE